MNDQQLDTLFVLLFLPIYTIAIVAYWYLSWFRYPRLFALMVRNFRWWNGSFSHSKGFWPSYGRKVMLHWSYKWQIRIASTFGMVIVLVANVVLVIAALQNLLLLLGR